MYRDRPYKNIYGKRSGQAKDYRYIDIHLRCNGYSLVWGSLRLAPIITTVYISWDA